MTSTQPPQSGDVIFTARRIRTANPSQPTATAIAVRDSKVLSVGTLEDCQQWGITNIDRQFEDKVLTAGFVEAHSHVMTGMYATFPYVGWFGRHMPDGTWIEGVKSTAELVSRIATIAATSEAGHPIVVSGFDPIYLDTERLSCHHLDEATTQHPVFVFHASGHLATINSFSLAKYNIEAGHPAPGVGFDEHGQPNGELREPAAMALSRDEFRLIGQVIFAPDTLEHFGNSMRNAGITTATDLGNNYHASDDVLSRIVDATGKDSFPVRVASVPRIFGGPSAMNEFVQKVEEARSKTHDKLHIPVVKMVLDGSIQGFTAVVNWPGYFTGDDHGLFLFPPEQVIEYLRPFHEAGIGIHCHCNGSTTSGVFIDAIEQLLREHAWLDHRHTITHAQLITQAQMRKAKNLGMSANFFVNHMWFWGEQHRDITVGPDRAASMNPCATADRIGLQYAFHSDSPVTPANQLHTMWAAVNRATPHGDVVGLAERIDVDRAFHAATIDGAYQLHMDHLVGSLEVGKFADMTVLEEDPYDVDASAIRDISIWGTIVGGIPSQSTVTR